MAWEISISPEGWSEIYDACHAKSKMFLFDAVNEARQQAGKKKIPRRWRSSISQSALADEAYLFTTENRTCDNGGFKYWIDKKGFYKVELSV
jgi:hypothetical protein